MSPSGKIDQREDIVGKQQKRWLAGHKQKKIPETKRVWEQLVMDEGVCGDYTNLEKIELY